MAWSVRTWKKLRIFQSQFLFGKVRAKTRHISYTLTLPASVKTTLQTLSRHTKIIFNLRQLNE